MSRVTINGGRIADVDFAGAELNELGLFDGVEVLDVTFPQGVILIRDSCYWNVLRSKVMQTVRKADKRGVEADLLFLDSVGLPMLLTPSSFSSLSKNDAQKLLKGISQSQ